MLHAKFFHNKKLGIWSFTYFSSGPSISPSSFFSEFRLHLYIKLQSNYFFLTNMHFQITQEKKERDCERLTRQNIVTVTICT